MKIKISLLDLLDLGVHIHQVTGKMEAIRILNVKFPRPGSLGVKIKMSDQQMDLYEDDLTVVWDVTEVPTTSRDILDVNKVPYSIFPEAK